jgi:hypothetical protein
MPLNINGYTLSNLSGQLAFGASGTRVLPSYGIRNPMLPGMLGSATGGGAYKCYPFPVNDVNLNVGSPWSTTTFAFTCPVTGIYYTSFGGLVGTTTNSYHALIINGVNWYFSYRNSNAAWEIHHIEMLVRLAAGDTIRWAMNAAPSPDTSSAGGAYQSNHNTCTIWLVG